MLLLLSSLAAAQPVLLQVTLLGDISADGVTVALNRLGESRQVRLVDDGSVPADLPDDNIWVGWDRGEYARVLPVSLYLEQEEQTLIYAGVEDTESTELIRLGWEVRTAQGWLEATRTAAVPPGNISGPSGTDPLLIALGWGGVVMCWVGWMAVLMRREPA